MLTHCVTVCFTFSGFLGILIGILHQTNFYCLNLIFWILVMGCGKVRFGQRGLKTIFTWTFGIKICCQGFRGAAPQASRGGAPGSPLRSQVEPIETPGNKFWDKNVAVYVVFMPLRPKQVIPHNRVTFIVLTGLRGNGELERKFETK